MAYKYKRKRKWLPELSGKKGRTIKFIGFAILFIAIGFAISILVSTYLPEVESNMLYILALPELLTTDYTQVGVEADVVNGVGVVALTGDCMQIIAYTEAEQAQSILNGLVGYVGERPNTHDMAKDAFESFGIEVNMLKITGVRNDTFLGRLILQKGRSVASLDVRPSDGTAIAIRMDAPIYIKDSLLEEYGVNIC
jgi:bifunctional DNase/RNase